MNTKYDIPGGKSASFFKGKYMLYSYMYRHG